MGRKADYTFEIKWRKSKDLLNDYIDRYNAGKKLGEQLRSSHRKLAEYILYIYSNHIQRRQIFESLKPDTPLPSLYTNNQQLARELGVARRTIINLRKRLVQAKVITEETWHGTNSQYEVHLSPKIIHIQHRSTDNVILYFYPPAGMGPDFFTRMVKSLHHTVSSTLQDTNQLNKLSGADFPQSADSQSFDENHDVDKCGKPHFSGGKPASDSTQDTNQGTSTGYETSQMQKKDKKTQETPPQVAAAPPNTLGEAIEMLDNERKKLIRRNVDLIWVTASINLYKDDWLTDGEIEKAKAKLAEYFVYSSPKQIAAGSKEIIGRIILVKKWIDRRHAKGLKGFVPIPSIYFDYRNAKGFRNTKSWYKQHRAQLIGFKKKELTTKALNEYMKSLEDNAPVSPADVYNKISARLYRNGGQELLDEFNTIISQLNSNNNE